MKRILLIIMVLFTTTIATAQTKTFEKEVLKISKRIDLITKTQKDSLKMKVIEIDKKLKKGEITKSTADTLKKEIASYHAKQIEQKVGEQERLLQLLVQDKTNGKIVSASENDLSEDEVNTFTIGSKVFRFTVNEDETREKKRKKRKRNRGLSNKTTSQFVFAMGVNNVLANNKISSLNNSEYKFWQSHFYELGFTWKTRLTKRPSQLYFKYGVSFLWNNLRLKNNQYHIKNGDVTEIKTFPENLLESRLRHVQMNFPMHIEWDLSKNKKYKDGYVHDRTNRSVRLGVGGFVGFKLGTRQYLEYKDNSGVEKTQVAYDNFNMNTVNYGLSAFLGYKSTSFYVKYDLNPLFKDTETRNISMGIRLDLN
ncbi:hypothetical protein [Polaribacter cellanae]|uniref:Outer membrane protein beta-barrel domain-containing protein n=1 Tax=Polaribacter cellanae TaxID=2818493 RepID=A0A975H9M6_9FLAO|nr:hypothetical protein [Polaribacter cellanae]QTE23085.1 hypothetical protein J3359_02075 [Polaribacter cellanae]